jgi:MFS superfamily sulfate permease-like transporter
VSAEQIVAAVAGTVAIVASLLAMLVARPRPTNSLEALYLVVPVAGVIVLVAAVARL